LVALGNVRVAALLDPEAEVKHGVGVAQLGGFGIAVRRC
jgi:hypothetical protein